jgi:NADH dehydrogenase [ubiquinone] 1 alpha subcomplex assembly factor 1
MSRILVKLKRKMLQSRILLILIALIMNNLILFDFSAADDWSGWQVENDVVMGGNSSSKLERSSQGNAVFTGRVSLENNGGFASLQYHFPPENIENYKKAILYVKGDGKKWQFRTKADLEDKASYVYEFTTTGDWQTVEVPLNEMKPVYRGRKLDIPNFSANTIQEIRFLIGNKKEENFRLEIDKIELVNYQ